MHTITGKFASKDAADKAWEALSQAGVNESSIAIKAGDGDSHILDADVDENLVDAARAIFDQAGAADVTDVDGAAASVEGEEVARIGNPMSSLMTER